MNNSEVQRIRNWEQSPQGKKFIQAAKSEEKAFLAEQLAHLKKRISKGQI
jgi:hypothetical protein